MDLQWAANSANWQIEEAYDRALANGYINQKTDGYYKGQYNHKHGVYQAIWRYNLGEDPTVYPLPAMEVFNMRDCETAILDALIHQGGIIAWNGDGVGCVSQMVETAYRERDYWKDRALKAEAK